MSFHLDDLVDLMKSEEKPSSSRNTAKKASVLFFSFGVKAWSDQKIGMITMIRHSESRSSDHHNETLPKQVKHQVDR